MQSPLTRLFGLAAYIGRNQTAPNQKALIDALVGMARTGNAILSRWAAIGTESADYESRVRRYSEAGTARSFDLDEAWTQLRTRNQRYLREDRGRNVVVAVDYTDAEHRYADIRPGHDMAIVRRTWNGSEHVETVGLPIVLIEAIADGADHTGAAVRRRIPLSLMPYDRNAPSYKSDNLVFLDQIKEVAAHVGSEALFVLDRGYDGRSFFAGMDALGLLWAVRLRIKPRLTAHPGTPDIADTDGPAGPEDDEGGESYPTTGADESRQLGIADSDIPAGGRLLIDEQGLSLTAREHAFKAPRRCGWVERWRKSGDQKKVTVHAKIVFLPGKGGRGVDPTPRTLIAVRTEGYSTPLVLLASHPLMDKADIERFARGYYKRWNAETMVRQFKNRSGWGLSYEDSRVLNGRSIQRMAFLVAAYQTFLSEIQAAGRLSMEPLVSLVQTTAGDPTDWRYRLSYGLQQYMTAQLHEVELRRRRSRASDPPPDRYWMEFPQYREHREARRTRAR